MGYMHKIAIVNQKGGVGKTTTAINLSASLGFLGFKTLLIDADPQANSSIGLGLDPNNLERTFYDVLSDRCKLSEAIIKTDFSGLSILPSNDQLYAADIELTYKDSQYGTFASKLSNNSIDQFDFIVFDSPPNLGPLTLNIMKATNTVIIPVKPDFLTLQGIAILLKNFEKIKLNLNPDIVIRGVLLTMYNSSLNLCKEVEENIRGYFGDLIFSTKITQNVTLAEAPGYGKPVMYYNFKSSGSENYRLFAAEFLKRLHIDEKEYLL
jgi:chromosome partitioning protein